MTDAAEKTPLTKPPAAPVFMVAQETPPAAPETAVSPEFDTKDLPIALHTRLAMDKDALDPAKKDLPQIKDEDLNNLEATIKVAEDASTAERVDYWEKRWQEMVAADPSLKDLNDQQKAERMQQVWIAEVVEKIQLDSARLSVLARKSIGGINLSGFKAETAKQIYDRYFQNDGRGTEVEVVIVKSENEEKITIPSRIKQFVDDILEYYKENGQVNYSQLEREIDNWHWYGGIFGNITEAEKAGEKPVEVHANDIIRDILETQIKLADAQKRELQLRQTNQQAIIENKPTFRHNWLNNYEDKELTYLKVKSQRTRRTTVARTGAPPPTPQPTTPTPPTGEKPKLFYERMKNPRIFPEQTLATVDEISRELAIRRLNSMGIDASKNPERVTELSTQLRQQIEAESAEITDFRNRIGLNNENFAQIVNKINSKFRDYLSKDPYNINPPNIKNATVQILSATMVEYYRHQHDALAFVDPNKSIIFLNWKVIYDRAIQMKYDLTKKLNTFVQFEDVFSHLLNSVDAHELQHLYGDIAYWYSLHTPKTEFAQLTPDEKKQATVIAGRSGIRTLKPNVKSATEVEFLDRIELLDEAVTEKLNAEFNRSLNPSFQVTHYVPEIKVLDEIIQKTGVNFLDFVRAKFDRAAFLTLNQKLAGRQTYPDEKGVTRIRYTRPKHYLQIVDALMALDLKKSRQSRNPVDYSLAMAFVDKNFNDTQKQDVANYIRSIPDHIFPPAAKAELAAQLGLPYEPPKRSTPHPKDEAPAGTH